MTSRFGHSLTCAGVRGERQFVDWLESEHDEQEWSGCDLEVAPDGSRVRAVIVHGSRQHYCFELGFPCTVSTVNHELACMEATVGRHQRVAYLEIDEIGDLDSFSQLAHALRVDREGLANTFGDGWVLTDGPEFDYNGAHIYRWFMSAPAESSGAVLLGLGGDSIYLERAGSDGSCQTEWPEPVVAIPEAAFCEDGFVLSDADFFELLAFRLTGLRGAEAPHGPD